MTENKKKSAADYSPVFGFVISYFIFHLIGWTEASCFVFSTLVSLLVYMLEIRFLKEDHEVNKKSLKSASYYTGLLSVMTIIVFVMGILNWYRLIPISWRIALLLFSVVIYFAILFRAIHVLIMIKEISEKKKPSR